MANEDSDTTPTGDRRQDDRRKTQAPIEGEDRRKGQRRSGADRRATPRS